MPAEKLGGGVNDHVGAQLQRFLEDGGGKGIVGNNTDVALASAGGQLGKINAAQCGIGRRFEEQHASLAGEIALDVLQFVEGNEHCLDAAAGEHLLKHLERAAVDVEHAYEFIAGLAGGENSGQ